MRASVVPSHIHGTASRAEVLRQALPFSGASLGGSGMTRHGLDELRARLEARATEAEAMHATAPLADTLRWVIAELGAMNGNGNAKASPAPAKLLTAREAAALLGVTPRWLYRQAKRLPFTRRLGPKTVRFDAEGLATWQAKV